MAKGDQRKGHLALGIYIQQAVYRGVHKPADYLGGQAQGGGDGQQVGQQSAVVPAKMAIGAGLILPGIAPVGGGADDGERRVSDGRFAAGGLDQDAAIVSGAQLAQAEFGGSEVVDAGQKVGEVATNEVELNLVERPGAGGRAKIDFAARILSLPRDACRKVQELCYGLQIRRGIGLDGSGRLPAMAERAATPVWRTSAGMRDGSSDV